MWERFSDGTSRLNPKDRIQHLCMNRRLNTTQLLNPYPQVHAKLLIRRLVQRINDLRRFLALCDNKLFVEYMILPYIFCFELPSPLSLVLLCGLWIRKLRRKQAGSWWWDEGTAWEDKRRWWGTDYVYTSNRISRNSASLTTISMIGQQFIC